ncbi:telomere zinc finger-associated protein-like [Liolophura sinensis]|uniref:telomere zinc finger-associated protein-like n=1 Tax=Liolophura sinensis TaxID=3198878 RepID=UPI003158D913
MEGFEVRTLSSAKHGHHVLQGLQNMRRQQLFCDAHLKAKDGDALDVHKILLMSCSRFFHSHFTSNHRKAEVLKLPEASYRSLSALLDFVYTGDLVLTEESVGSIQDLAVQLQLDDATDLCKQFSLVKSDKFVAEVTSITSLSSNDPKPLGDHSDDVDEEEPIALKSPDITLSINAESIKSPKIIRSQRSSAGVCAISSSVLQNPCNSLEQCAEAGVSGAKCRKPGRPQTAQIADEVKDLYKSRRARRKCTTPKKLQDFTLASGKLEKSNTCSDNNVPSPVPVKRGRGRPKKVVKLEEEGNNKSAGVTDVKACPTEPKRKRGRPLGSKGKKKQASIGAIDDVKLQETRLTDKGSSKCETPKDETQCIEKIIPINKYKRKHKCRRCRKEFDSVDLLEKHRIQCRKVHNFDQSDKYKRKRCAKCQIEFPDFESYQEHRETHKKERNLTWKKKPHICDICDQSFRYESFLACHRYSKHKISFDESKHKVLTCPVPTCDFATLNKWRFRIHSEQHGDQRPFVCDVCGKTFKVSSSLTTHKKSHNQERRFQCEECGKKFLQLSGKEQHVKRIHKKEMSFLCHLCPYKCFVKSELLQHLHKDHQIPLPSKYVRYKCELCDFMTFRRFHYLNHMNMHEGNRMYECELWHVTGCMSVNCVMFDLVIAGNQVYECELCHVTRCMNVNCVMFDLVVAGNRMYECELCHKKYTSKVVLRCHMQFHKEPRHKCPWEGCKYAAVQKRRLNQHIQLIHTHKDVKPFECHLCTYKSALNGNLKLHLRNVHHLNLPKRQMVKWKGETTVSDNVEDEVSSSVVAYDEKNPTLLSINRSDIVRLAVASCEDISPVATPDVEENTTETVVIYTTDPMLPAQVTAAQVLQQLSSGNPIGHAPSTTVTETVTIVSQAGTISHLSEASQEHELSVKNERGEIIHRSYGHMAGEITTGVAEDMRSDLNAEIHIPVSKELSQDTRQDTHARHSDMASRDLQSDLTHLSQDLNSQIYVTNREVNDGMIREMQMGELSPNRDGSGDVRATSTSDLGRDSQRDSGLVIQEIMNAQYPPETFLPDSRNLNIMIQSMENREGFVSQPNTYWTQY